MSGLVVDRGGGRGAGSTGAVGLTNGAGEGQGRKWLGVVLRVAVEISILVGRWKVMESYLQMESLKHLH